MSRYIDADAIDIRAREGYRRCGVLYLPYKDIKKSLDSAPSIDIVRCKECRKSHIDGKTTHYLWCTEWGRSTDTFGYCERGEREGE